MYSQPVTSYYQQTQHVVSILHTAFHSALFYENRPGLASLWFCKVEVNNSTPSDKPLLQHPVTVYAKKREVIDVDFKNFHKDEDVSEIWINNPYVYG